MKVKAARDIYVTDVFGGDLTDYINANFGVFNVPWDRETGLFVAKGTEGILNRITDGMMAEVKFEGREPLFYTVDMYDII